MEGISPTIHFVKGTFIFSLQDKLYTLTLEKVPILKEICTGLDCFAINETNAVYYKFVSEEKTEARYLNINNFESSTNIDQSLNSEVYKCVESHIVTTIINGKFISYYIICGTPYMLIDGKWKKESEVVIYEDEKIKVNYIKKGDKINEKAFTYNCK